MQGAREAIGIRHRRPAVTNYRGQSAGCRVSWGLCWAECVMIWGVGDRRFAFLGFDDALSLVEYRALPATLDWPTQVATL
jgi:hypothetical protein